jgi:hypothetical protein
LIERAAQDLYTRAIADHATQEKVVYVVRCVGNRAAVRFLMACLLAKIDRPAVDPRKPYTEIGDKDAFSGRFYDESCITPFITRHNLPCNATTAFLTPAFRNIKQALTTEVEIVGRPRRVYIETLQLLDVVHNGVVSAEDLFTDILRELLLLRNEKAQRMETLLSQLRREATTVLSAEAIIGLIEQHLACKGASRLPVLIVAAAYQAASTQLGEQSQPLQSHNAADEQTGSLGDVEITLLNDDRVITCYEMKMKRVIIADIDRAIYKLAKAPEPVDSYVFITTDVITQEVQTYAAQVYGKSGGTEMVVLDCIGFLRHFLHLFHRRRGVFMDAYQSLLLAEPDSAVSQALKEAFLVLRRVAEESD